jgi:hypothetical protein
MDKQKGELGGIHTPHLGIEGNKYSQPMPENGRVPVQNTFAASYIICWNTIVYCRNYTETWYFN